MAVIRSVDELMSARLLALLLLCSIRGVDGSYHQYPGCQQCSCNVQLGTVDCSGSVSPPLMSLPLADSLPRKGIRILYVVTRRVIPFFYAIHFLANSTITQSTTWTRIFFCLLKIWSKCKLGVAKALCMSITLHWSIYSSGSNNSLRQPFFLPRRLKSL